MNRMSVTEKLAINKYELDEGVAHIEVNQEICRTICKIRACLTVCPASVYTEGSDGTIAVDWAGCLECGTCKVACESKALSWVYPRGGFGVLYRYG